MKAEDFGLFDEDGILQIQQTEAIVYVGGQASDNRSKVLTGREVTAIKVKVEAQM